MELSEYFRSQAEWRDRKAADYPDDQRNAQSARALRSLADYAEHEDAADLVRALAPFSREVILGGEETARQVSRYGFGYEATSDGQHRELLEDLQVTCLQDAYSEAMDAGEDWTGALFPLELAAANRGVLLPERYFRYRGSSSEDEIAAAIAQYEAE